MRLILNQGLSSDWSFSMGENQPTVFRASQPDEEDLRSYLLTFRKFISPKEPVFIRYIHNLCDQYLTSDELKGQIRDCQQGWKNHCVRGGIKLNIHGRDVRPEHIADLWINGHYFHDNLEKAKELERYMPFSILFVRQQFLHFVIEATRVIGGTGYTVKMALRDGAVSD